MSFLLLLIILSLASAVMLWGLSVFFQGFLYNTRADKLPLRAAAGGLALGMFLSLWTFLNVKADIPNKYGTLLEFNSDAVTQVQQFKAVRYFSSSKEEQTVTYVRIPTTPDRNFLFVEANPDGTPDLKKPYNLFNGLSMTTAIILVETGKPESRFETELSENPRTGKTYKKAENEENAQKIFLEKGGKRYLHGENPDKVMSPSRGSMFGAMALNLLNFVVWFLVLWLGLRYTVFHSVGMAFVAGIATMVVLMPLLFQRFAK